MERVHRHCLAPLQILHIIVLFVCIVVTGFQLAECLRKLLHPPIATRSRFALNSTMTYPAVTVCRVPAFKPEVIKKFGLESDVTITTEWINFHWENTTLQQFWDEATYKLNETIRFYGISGQQEKKNIAVVSNYYLNNGQCHSLIPLIQTSSISLQSGWSLLLKTDWMKNVTQNGWDVYIHDATQPWSENPKQTEGFVEHEFLEPGAEIHFKLEVKQINKINHNDDPCSSHLKYGTTKCADLCRWQDLIATYNCSTPWMPGFPVPHCDNYRSFRAVTNTYRKFTPNNATKCGCVQPCKAFVYQMYAAKRTSTGAMNYSQLFVYFTSKMVTMLEERPGYDWSAFTSDLGGSLGFLLGLSVLSIIGIIEKVFQIMFVKVGPPQINEHTKEDATGKRVHEETNSSMGVETDQKLIEYLESIKRNL